MHKLIQSASSMLHYIQIIIHIILLFYRSLNQYQTFQFLQLLKIQNTVYVILL
nr:MAG TPA: hypothetical protein [Caudoviricetes sp.]DAT99377.1 MAG TPA: hypothetical protein [Caudoviricetes sp.]